MTTTNNLYESSGVSSTKGQLIQGGKAVQGEGQVYCVKSQNLDYFNDSTTPSGAVQLPSADVAGTIDQMIPIAANTMVLTAWVEIIEAAVGTAIVYDLGTNTPDVGAANTWGTAIDMTQVITFGGYSGTSGSYGGSGVSGTQGATGPIAIGGSNSPFVPTISPLMFPNGGTIDLTAKNITAMTSNAVVVVYALCVNMNF